MVDDPRARIIDVEEDRNNNLPRLYNAQAMYPIGRADGADVLLRLTPSPHLETKPSATAARSATTVNIPLGLEDARRALAELAEAVRILDDRARRKAN